MVLHISTGCPGKSEEPGTTCGYVHNHGVLIPPCPPVGGSKVPSRGALAALTSLRFGQLRRPGPPGPSRPWRYGPASLLARLVSRAQSRRPRACASVAHGAIAHAGLVGAESRGSRPRVGRRCFQPAPRAASQRWRSAHCLGWHRSHLLAFLACEVGGPPGVRTGLTPGGLPRLGRSSMGTRQGRAIPLPSGSPADIPLHPDNTSPW